MNQRRLDKAREIMRRVIARRDGDDPITLMAAALAEAEGEWKSVGEVPDGRAEVLVTDGKKIDTGMREGGVVFHGNAPWMGRATHWRELPPLPEVKS